MPSVAGRRTSTAKVSRSQKDMDMPHVWQAANGTRQLWLKSPVERDGFIRNGVPVQYVDGLAGRLGVTKTHFYRMLNISRATVSRKRSEEARLSVDNSDKVVGLAKLVGQVETMVQESGDPTGFDAAQWLAGWMSKPVAALGNRCPEEFMETSDGREMVSQLLARAQSGAYS